MNAGVVRPPFRVDGNAWRGIPLKRLAREATETEQKQTEHMRPKAPTKRACMVHDPEAHDGMRDGEGGKSKRPGPGLTVKAARAKRR